MLPGCGLDGKEEIALILSRRKKSVEAMRIFGVRCLDMTPEEMAACLCHFLDGGDMGCVVWDGDDRTAVDVWKATQRRKHKGN